MVNILPESRARIVRGSVRTPDGNMVPIFCANCGKRQGFAPEHMITFAFALCQPCADVYGDSAHFYSEPDADFFGRVAEEQRAAGIQTVTELANAIDDPSTPIAKLAKDWQAKMRSLR